MNGAHLKWLSMVYDVVERNSYPIDAGVILASQSHDGCIEQFIFPSERIWVSVVLIHLFPVNLPAIRLASVHGSCEVRCTTHCRGW